VNERPKLRLALAQMNSVVADKDANVARAVAVIHDAAEKGADVVVLPEFFNTEYFPQYRDYAYLDYAEALTGPSLSAIAETARERRVWVVATILEREKAGVFYDTAVLFDRDGSPRGKYRKTHPAAVLSLEKIYFRYGSTFPVFEIEGWRAGIMICYDTFFGEVPRTLALRGAELLLVPFAAPKHKIWRELLMLRAFENGCYIGACNKVGLEGAWVFAGESLIAAPTGDIVDIASATEDGTVIADLDHGLVEASRREYPMFRDRRPDLYGALVAPTETL
jgi:N-carbamoylputrescine amidase